MSTSPTVSMPAAPTRITHYLYSDIGGPDIALTAVALAPGAAAATARASSEIPR
ncbi:hypothetical protein ACWC0C_07370 [Streptomyces sp. NPDC001709]